MKHNQDAYNVHNIVHLEIYPYKNKFLKIHYLVFLKIKANAYVLSSRDM